jgi:hypothetical protein
MATSSQTRRATGVIAMKAETVTILVRRTPSRGTQEPPHSNLIFNTPRRVGVTHLGVVEDGHAKGVFLLEIAKLHVVLAACHELPPEDTGTHPVLVDRSKSTPRAIDLLGETRCCGPPLLSDPPFILADEVGSYSLHRTSYLPRR